MSLLKAYAPFGDEKEKKTKKQHQQQLYENKFNTKSIGWFRRTIIDNTIVDQDQLEIINLK